jgi:hypothetical protein
LLSKSSDPQRHLREPQIFSNTAVTASNLQQYCCHSLKSSAILLSQLQIFSNTAVTTSNLQQYSCHSLKLIRKLWVLKLNSIFGPLEW